MYDVREVHELYIQSNTWEIILSHMFTAELSEIGHEHGPLDPYSEPL